MTATSLAGPGREEEEEEEEGGRLWEGGEEDLCVGWGV